MAVAVVLTAGLSLPAGAATAAPGPSPAAVPAATYPPELAPYYTQVLTWSACEGDLTCAWLTVPLDYANPSGTTITLRVARHAATG